MAAGVESSLELLLILDLSKHREGLFENIRRALFNAAALVVLALGCGLAAASHEGSQLLPDDLLRGGRLLGQRDALEVDAQTLSCSLDAARWQIDVSKVFKLEQLVSLQSILQRPCQLLGYLLPLRLAACVVLQLHVQVERALRAVELVAAVVRADEALLDFVSAPSEVLLPAALVALELHERRLRRAQVALRSGVAHLLERASTALVQSKGASTAPLVLSLSL